MSRPKGSKNKPKVGRPKSKLLEEKVIGNVFVPDVSIEDMDADAILDSLASEDEAMNNSMEYLVVRLTVVGRKRMKPTWVDVPLFEK